MTAIDTVDYQLEHFDDVWGQLGDPALVEQRFLQLLPQAYALENKSIYLQILSQIALAQAVLKKFDAAHATLDQAEKLVTPEYDLARVRILCERGRVFQQAGDIAQARIYFEQSYQLSAKCRFDKQTINAAHMIAIVAPTLAEKIAWNNTALDLAMQTHDAFAQSWRGPLLNNLGANYLEDHQLEPALHAFEQALLAFEKSPEHSSNIRFAKFRIAQVLRMLGRLDESLAMLHLQIQEYDAIMMTQNFGMPVEMFMLMRGWLYEELAVVCELQCNQDQAIKYARLAVDYLDNNQLFVAIDPTAQVRVEKLKKLCGDRVKSMADKNNVYKDYEKIADWFDQHRSRTFFEKPYLDKVISYLQPGATILDLGCGMGEPIAQYFIAQRFDLTGIDGSSKLITLAQQRFPKARWIVQDMRDIELSKKFDCIIVWHSLFHLPADDQRKMFTIFANHLNHGGVLLFTSGHEAGEVWSDNGGENLYHASLSADEYEKLLKQHDFELLLHNMQDESCGDATVWMARLK